MTFDGIDYRPLISDMENKLLEAYLNLEEFSIGTVKFYSSAHLFFEREKNWFIPSGIKIESETANPTWSLTESDNDSFAVLLGVVDTIEILNSDKLYVLGKLGNELHVRELKYRS